MFPRNKSVLPDMSILRVGVGTPHAMNGFVSVHDGFLQCTAVPDTSNVKPLGHRQYTSPVTAPGIATDDAAAEGVVVTAAARTSVAPTNTVKERSLRYMDGS